MAQVVIRSLNKKFDEVHAVKDVNLDIRDKEFMVFVGPSGCGKTTTLRMVAGLESITSGRILIDDKVINDLPPMDRDIAMVFQNYALYPHMSVYDNMAFGLKMRKFDRADIARRVQEAAEILGIQELLRRKPRQLSGGQRQRVAVARALLRDAPIILLDEATAALDSESEKQVQEAIEHLCRNRTTIVIAHRLHTIMHADTILVVEGGEIVESGRHDDLLRRSGRYASFFRLQQRDASPAPLAPSEATA
jgi:multiple sugar transport system ATP-binding protein